MTAAHVTDGRAARKAATRDAIADALLDLLAQGNMRPTAREIAQQAGTSVRSVYVHFDDLEDLFVVAANRQLARVRPLLSPVVEEGPLRRRAEAVVRRRAQLYEEFGAVRRATELQAPFSPTLQRLVVRAHSRARAELEQVFTPELRACSPDVAARVLGAADAVTTGAAWDVLRVYHGMDSEQATTTMVDALVACMERT